MAPYAGMLQWCCTLPNLPARGANVECGGPIIRLGIYGTWVTLAARLRCPSPVVVVQDATVSRARPRVRDPRGCIQRLS